MIKPETGKRIKTNKVNSTLIKSMILIEITTVKGSLTKVSIDVKIEFSTSCTSAVMRAIMSPFLFSVK